MIFGFLDDETKRLNPARPRLKNPDVGGVEA
jgi:hypothetical protein